MTVQTKNQLKALFWTVIAGLILLTTPKVASQVILRPEYAEHVKTEVRMLDNILTLQCRTTPDDTICRDYK